LSDIFPVQNDLKRSRCSTAIALQFCLRICFQESSRKSSQFEIEWVKSAIGLCWWY